MDQLWKEFKGDLATNRQFRNIAEAVDYAEQWVLNLTGNQALQKANVFSKSYWLRHFLKKVLATYLNSITASIAAVRNFDIQQGKDVKEGRGLARYLLGLTYLLHPVSFRSASRVFP